MFLKVLSLPKNKDIIELFYKPKTALIKKDLLVDEYLYQDIVDIETGEIVVSAGKQINYAIFDEITKQNKKAYRMRYGNFQKAWNFVEAHLKVAVENYSKTVEHMQKLLEKQRMGLDE